MGPSEDRRRFPRLCKSTTLRAQVLSYSNPQTQKEMIPCTDVGDGGLRFRSPAGYPEGTLLKIEGTIPGWGRNAGIHDGSAGNDDQPLVALARVVRVDTVGSAERDIAVQFLELQGGDHRTLLSLVQPLAEMKELEQKA